MFDLNYFNTPDVKKDVQPTPMFLKKKEKSKTQVIDLITFNKVGQFNNMIKKTSTINKAGKKTVIKKAYSRG
jgi:hypothetical protein